MSHSTLPAGVRTSSARCPMAVAGSVPTPTTPAPSSAISSCARSGAARRGRSIAGPPSRRTAARPSQIGQFSRGPAYWTPQVTQMGRSFTVFSLGRSAFSSGRGYFPSVVDDVLPKGAGWPVLLGHRAVRGGRPAPRRRRSWRPSSARCRPAGSVNGSRSRTTRSARLPGLMVPASSSWLIQAEPAVYAVSAVARSSAWPGRNGVCAVG